MDDLTRQVLAERWVYKADPAPGTSQHVLVAQGPRHVRAAQGEFFGCTIEIEWGQASDLAAARARIASAAPEALGVLLEALDCLWGRGEDALAERAEAALKKAGVL